jgi:DNA primase
LNTPQGKMEACKRLLPIIAEVRSRTLAGEYADRLAMKLRLDVKDVQRDLALARQRLDREARTAPTRAPIQESPDLDEELSDTAQKSHGAQATNGATYRDAAHAPPEVSQEEYCLGLALDHPETWREARAILREDDFTATARRRLGWRRCSPGWSQRCWRRLSGRGNGSRCKPSERGQRCSKRRAR